MRPSVYRPKPVRRSSFTTPCSNGSLPTVNHPGYTESIREHTETGGPEGFLEWHPHRPILGQCVEYPVRIERVLDGELHRDAFWFLIARRRSVGAHQHAD